jgi:hypothetical protein
MRKKLAILAAVALPFTFAACDDDGDGNIDNPDLDPGGGTGLPGDDLDNELDDGTGDTDG